MPRPVVLTCCDFYWPGVKLCGPVTSIAGLTARLSDEFEFRILTRPWPGDAAATAATTQVHRVESIVTELPGFWRFPAALRRELRAGDFDLLYLNSLFSPCFSLMPLLIRRLRLCPPRPVILAPRGELSPGAIQLGHAKKRAFLRAFKATGLHCDITWQATSELEAEHIRGWFGDSAKIAVAANLATATIADSAAEDIRPHKSAGHLRMLFLSRISPKKNLLGAIKLLQTPLAGTVEFTIAGPIDDAGYWSECRRELGRMPANVTAKHIGGVPPAEVAGLMQRHDLLLLPTFGENFGHVVVESLAAGCPVLISDQTPWRELPQAAAGWDLPLDRPDEFHAALGRCLSMTDEEHRTLRLGAMRFAEQRCLTDGRGEATRAMFRAALWPAESPRVQILRRAA